MNLKQLGLSLATAVAISCTVVSCAPKDQDIKTNVENAIAAPEMMVSVEQGVATISGQTATEEERQALEAKAKNAKGVKSVNNLITVEPVQITQDDPLNTAVQAVVSQYPGLVATVSGGVVTLSGEISRSDLPKAMAAISATNPGKIDNKATVK